MKTGKIILTAFFGLIFSTAAIAQTDGTDPRKEIKNDVVAIEKVDARMSNEQIAQPAEDEAPVEKIVDDKDKDKKKKSAKKSCCSKDKEKATKGCEKKD